MKRGASNWMTFFIAIIFLTVLGFGVSWIFPSLFVEQSLEILGTKVIFNGLMILFAFLAFLITLFMKMNEKVRADAKLDAIITAIVGLFLVLVAPIVLGVHAILSIVVMVIGMIGAILIGYAAATALLATYGTAAETVSFNMVKGPKPMKKTRKRKRK